MENESAADAAGTVSRELGRLERIGLCIVAAVALGLGVTTLFLPGDRNLVGSVLFVLAIACFFLAGVGVLPKAFSVSGFPLDFSKHQVTEKLFNLLFDSLPEDQDPDDALCDIREYLRARSSNAATFDQMWNKAKEYKTGSSVRGGEAEESTNISGEDIRVGASNWIENLFEADYVTERATITPTNGSRGRPPVVDYLVEKDGKRIVFEDPKSWSPTNVNWLRSRLKKVTDDDSVDAVFLTVDRDCEDEAKRLIAKVGASGEKVQLAVKGDPARAEAYLGVRA